MKVTQTEMRVELKFTRTFLIYELTICLCKFNFKADSPFVRIWFIRAVCFQSDVWSWTGSGKKTCLTKYMGNTVFPQLKLLLNLLRWSSGWNYMLGRQTEMEAQQVSTLGRLHLTLHTPRSSCKDLVRVPVRRADTRHTLDSLQLTIRDGCRCDF